jgi:hypothetical protein
MRKFLLLGFGFAALFGLAASGNWLFSGDKVPDPAGPPAAEGDAKGVKLAPSKVVKVTVYPNSALVTREVDVPKGDGLTELTISELPNQTVQNSLYSEGNDGVRILSTRYRTRPVQQDTREEVRKLQDEMKKLQLSGEKIDSDVKTLESNIAMLGKLENFTDKTAVTSTEKGGLSSETIIKLATYVMEQRAEKGKELTKLKQESKANRDQLEFLQRKLANTTAGTSRTDRDAVIVVDRVKGGGGKIRLNYLVDAVSWAPQYKFRAGKTDEPVLLDYLAGLTQQSGEDWIGVDITLSTAQPMLNAAPPDLKRLDVAIVPNPMGKGALAGNPGLPSIVPGAPPGELAEKARGYRMQAQEFFNSKKDAESAGKLLNEAAALDQNRELTKTREELEGERLAKGRPAGAEGPSVSYHLKTKYTVPSRHDEQVIEVAKINLNPKFFYKAVPVLNPHVYRLADLVNKSEHVLLPGDATMYQNGDFVGRMSLPLVAIGEEFTAGFGVDPQLQVSRKLMDKTKSTQGGNQVLKYDYRILVSSYKKEAVTVQVWDRLPHSETNESAGISLLKTTPELSKDAMYIREMRPQNLLRWDLEVQPGSINEKAAVINYEFRIELDRQMAITSFTTK